MRPDFIFFSQDSTGTIRAHIVDPHGQFLADSLPKLVGLASYAESHAAHFKRIEAVAKVNEGFRSLNLKESDVRDAVRLGPSAKSLFEGAMAKPYLGGTK